MGGIARRGLSITELEVGGGGGQFSVYRKNIAGAFKRLNHLRLGSDLVSTTNKKERGRGDKMREGITAFIKGNARD